MRFDSAHLRASITGTSAIVLQIRRSDTGESKALADALLFAAFGWCSVHSRPRQRHWQRENERSSQSALPSVIQGSISSDDTFKGKSSFQEVVCMTTLAY